ncbi:arginyl-tRNA synthetase [Halobiforma haloterrestris]|uniref:Arginine--tRNA ligase n=1 Tax=Natronobacterium haloterrestre TaxID=148448 RepID=A0A1I1KWS3_NATHA|nr:arginine--tRNA ligase [Halobiforma haloterrestris]SFC61870.1 arginyl-tRNA synthetase [Halobiforma haloterrestris]
MLYQLRQDLITGLRDATADAGYDYEIDISDIEVEDVTDEEKGEFSSPLSFSIAADAGEPPVAVAESIADAHRANGLPDGIETVSVEGGHINYHADRSALASETLSVILEEGTEYGTRTVAESDTILADVSSPNIAKPLHVGHLRNTILSDAVMNVLEARGHDVTRDNHLGDWGVQFGNLMHEYTEFGNESDFESDPIEHLLDLYQQFEQRDSMLEDLEENEPVTDRFRESVEEEREYHAESGKEWFARLEQDDEQAVDLWETFREVSIDRFEETYADLDVDFDIWMGESFYAREGWNDVVIEKALENDVAMRGDGEAVYIPIYPDDYENVGDPNAADVDRSLDRAREMLEESDDLEDADFEPFYIVKSDGSTLYGTRDLATIEYRLQEYDADQSVYVVANEQERYFQQLFVAARKMGYDDIKLKHIDYGLISLPEGSMSTRKGQIITAREVLDRARDRARDIVEEKGRSAEDEIQAVANKIALATVKYEMVASKRARDITFDIDESVSLEGDTGPYVQYAATRGYSILDGADAVPAADQIDPSNFNETDVELLYELARYPIVLERCEERYDAAPLAHYLLELAHVFNSFYHKNQVLEAERARDERLVLTEATTQVFENGLDLLGIDVLEQM